ncbi:hypothetical protein PENTCL1PPCAC_2689, partial [Pristionchus entomophagus]
FTSGRQIMARRSLPSLECCNSCKEKITHVDAIRGNAIYTLGRVWHKAHLVCNRCNINVSEIAFRESTKNIGKPVCIDCHMMETHPKCSACTKTLVEDALMACGRYFHKECLKCYSCNNACRGGRYMVDNLGRIYDPDCYLVRILSQRYGIPFALSMHPPALSELGEGNC